MWSEKVLVSIVSSVKSLQLMMKQKLLWNIAFSRVNCDRRTRAERFSRVIRSVSLSSESSQRISLKFKLCLK